MSREPILLVDDLTVSYPRDNGSWQPVVEGVSLTLGQGERLGLVGSSGSGKSVTALACLGLVHPPGRRTGGRVAVAGVDLATATPEELRHLRGGVVGLVFQEPASCLNPVYTIGFQLRETIRSHHGMNRLDTSTEMRRLLEQVALPVCGRIAGAYPHELSGGQLQRVLIALALAGRPQVLIADEPTSALDRLTQAEILDLLAKLTAETGISLLLVSHDLAMVRETVERVAVMYAGRIVEQGATTLIFEDPRHPYTRALLAASFHREESRHSASADIPAVGCRYAPRCPLVEPSCVHSEPPFTAVHPGRLVRCPVTAGAGHTREEPADA